MSDENDSPGNGLSGKKNAGLLRGREVACLFQIRENRKKEG
jgi:hypothetical protein